MGIFLEKNGTPFVDSQQVRLLGLKSIFLNFLNKTSIFPAELSSCIIHYSIYSPYYVVATAKHTKVFLTLFSTACFRFTIINSLG